MKHLRVFSQVSIISVISLIAACIPETKTPTPEAEQSHTYPTLEGKEWFSDRCNIDITEPYPASGRSRLFMEDGVINYQVDMYDTGCSVFDAPLTESTKITTTYEWVDPVITESGDTAVLALFGEPVGGFSKGSIYVDEENNLMYAAFEQGIGSNIWVISFGYPFSEMSN